MTIVLWLDVVDWKDKIQCVNRTNLQFVAAQTRRSFPRNPANAEIKQTV